ncbi:hypothetical protein M9458_040595, partial [Cirrhinus mrigala]
SDKAKERRATDLKSTRGFERTFKKTEVGERKSREERSQESQATEKIRGFERTFKKTEVRERKSREERSQESQATEKSRPVFKSPVTHEKEQANHKGKYENAVSQISGRISSRHAATIQPSSKELEKKRQELVSRRSTAEHLTRTSAKDDCSSEKLQEKSRKLMKRRLSPELHAESKRRDVKDTTNAAHAESHSEVQKEMRKTLVARRSTKLHHNVGAQSSQDNSKEVLPVVKHVDSASKLKLQDDILPKKQKHVQLGNVPGVILGEKSTSFGGPRANVSFRIPKKASAVKAGANTDVCNVNSLASRTQNTAQPSFPDSTPSKHKFLVSQQQGQKLQEVSVQTSHKPSPLCLSNLMSVSHQVQQAQTDKTREVTTPSNTSCK